MGLNYEFMGKNTDKFVIPTSYYKQLDDSRWKPTRTGARLDFTVYLNITYSLPVDAKEDGRVRLFMMRENPDDETAYVDIELPRGKTSKLVTFSSWKYWGSEDEGRYVHFEVRAWNTKTCWAGVRYVTYSQVW